MPSVLHVYHEEYPTFCQWCNGTGCGSCRGSGDGPSEKFVRWECHACGADGEGDPEGECPACQCKDVREYGE